ncbi:MAG: D-alanyl-D-alanine carboxypeptidase/D-alanyl-D-alanine-endopeptidase [Actinobacteria bacterium]|nr:MAG: D-alanyl-D-alanine carboxypeptidase/D-alanyl-D-alanine-endopeptidase [Actinomycetota bacterium]
MRPMPLDRGRTGPDNGAMRRGLLAVLACAAAVAFPAAGALGSAGSKPLAQRLARALAVPHVPVAGSAAVAVDLTTGSAVFERHAGLALAPASNEKLAVTYAALAALGPDYQIETDVLGQGELVGTTWRGPLVLQGHGDPTLSHLDLRVLARQVRTAGIRKVAGSVLGDESYFDSRRTAPGWKPSFYINESAPLSALTVDRTWFHDHHSRVPAAAAAALFKDALRAQGVAVTGRATRGTAGTDTQQLADVLSPPLAQIARFMDRESDNFTAELLLKQLGAVNGAVGTTAGGAAAVRTELTEAGIPVAGVRIVDGSGLSPLDRLTARAIVGMLRAAWEDPTIKVPFVSALAVAGRSGTLKDRMRGPPARGVVLGKTGTTSLASALSGFVRQRYVFSVLQNGNPVSSFWARRAQDRFATVLATQ